MAIEVREFIIFVFFFILFIAFLFDLVSKIKEIGLILDFYLKKRLKMADWDQKLNFGLEQAWMDDAGESGTVENPKNGMSRGWIGPGGTRMLEKPGRNRPKRPYKNKKVLKN